MYNFLSPTAIYTIYLNQEGDVEEKNPELIRVFCSHHLFSMQLFVLC